MKIPNTPVADLPLTKILIRGIHLDLSPAMHSYALDKSARLLRHNGHIIRVRIDVEYDRTASIGTEFIAKGHIEIGGPDLLASVACEDAYKAIDLLVDKLDRLLARRHGLRKEGRHTTLPAATADEFPSAD